MLTIVKNGLILSRLHRRYGIKGFKTVARDKWLVGWKKQRYKWVLSLTGEISAL